MDYNIFKPSLDNDCVLPEDNTIDLTKTDLCEDCKSKLISEFMKAYGIYHEKTDRQS
jgi:hypothetical protein